MIDLARKGLLGHIMVIKDENDITDARPVKDAKEVVIIVQKTFTSITIPSYGRQRALWRIDGCSAISIIGRLFTIE